MSWLDTLEEIRKTDWSEKGPKEREAKAREVVNICAYASSVVAMVPVPFVDLALMLPVHSAMVMTIGSIYGRKVTQTEARRIAVELAAVTGVSVAGRAAISALKRILLPGVGGLLSITAAFALTWGIGRVSMEYFARPEISREDLKKVFQDALKEGKAAFSKDAFERFRAKNKDVEVPKDDAAHEHDGHSDAPPPPKKPEQPKDETLRPKKRSL
jgi:uncharacterized protein (DUF697 family)